MGSQIGTSAFGMVGNILGGFVGGPIGSAIGGMAGGMIGGMLFNKKAKPMVADVQLMNSSYGKAIPIVWGTMRLPGNMIWQSEIQTSESSVGKSFGQTAYHYKQSAALAFCEGPVLYRKLFLDGKLFYDNTALFPEELTKYKFPIRTYPGDDVQLPDPLMSYWVATHVIPAGSNPAYRGLAYMVFDNPDISHFGNRFPQTTCILTTTSELYTVFKKFNHFTEKGRAGWWAPYVDTAVDWVRGVVYALYRPLDWGGEASIYDDTNIGIMVFSLYTQTETHAADWNRIFFEGALIPSAFYGGNCHIRGITCAPGGPLYIVVTDYLQDYVMQVQTNTLVISGGYTTLRPRDAFFPYYALMAHHVRGFELASVAGGVSYQIAGYWLIDGVFVCNPLSMTISNPLHVEYADLFYTSHEYEFGAKDSLSGTQELWVFNLGYNDPERRVLVYKDKVVGSDPSVMAEFESIELVKELRAVEFGLDHMIFTDAEWHPGFSQLGYNAIAYAADDSVIVNYDGQHNVKYSSLSGVGWNSHGGGYGWSNPFADTSLGFFPLTGGGFIQMILDSMILFRDLDLMSGAQSISPIRPGEWVDNAVPGASVHSMSFGNFIVWQGFFEQELWISYLFRQDPHKARVADIIRDICHRVGMSDDMLDLSLVTQETEGYCIQEMKSAGSAIADLLHVYQIDMVESDYQLKFIPRGQPSVTTITQGDLVSLDQNDPSQYWRVKQAQQQEMPLIISLRFQDPALDFQTGATYAKRTEVPIPTVWSKRRMTVDLPVIATNLEATQIADKWLYTMWAERDTVETALSPKYLWLDPADNVVIAMDNGDVFQVRIEEETVGADLSMHLQATFEDNTVYNPSPTLRGADYGSLPQTVQQSPFAEFLQFNVPLLQDQDDTGGVSTRVYYAVGATSAGWTTGEIFRSLDNSATWVDYSGISFACNWGQAITKLPDTPSKFATDYDHTITVAMQAGSNFPLSCTYDEMLSGANGALLGEEVIQYQRAVLNDDRTVTLSNILRGRRGTEWATGRHYAGEQFIMLQAGKIGGSTLNLAEINVQELWKLVPSGRLIEQTPTDAFTYRGYDLMPYAPVGFKRAPSGPDLQVSWTRRTRLGNFLMDNTDTAPLYEASESYNAYILPDASSILLFNPANPLSYTRSYMNLPVPWFTYTASQMTSDGFYPATSRLFVAVYQVSSVVGMGFRGYDVLPAF
jgi:hypothetical protein